MNRKQRHDKDRKHISMLSEQQGVATNGSTHSRKEKSTVATVKDNSTNRSDDDNTSSVDTHLDECEICDDGGDLICCDGCEKAYHAECLNLDADDLPDLWYGPCCEKRSVSPSKHIAVATDTKADSGVTNKPIVATKGFVILDIKERSIVPQAMSQSSAHNTSEESTTARKGNNQNHSTNSIPNNMVSTQHPFRTVLVPAGVVEGSIFHVVIENGKKFGVVCPKGVQPGQTLIVLEPGCYNAPVEPEKIVKMNEAHFIEGFNGGEAEYAKRAFWEVLYPQLEGDWSFTEETSCNFGAYKFHAPWTTSKSIETISDVLKCLKSTGSSKNAVKEFYMSITSQRKAAQQKEGRKRKRIQDMATRSDLEKRIRVGSKYQVRSLPRAGSYDHQSSREHMPQQLWSCTDSTLNNQNDLHDIGEINKWKGWANERAFANKFHNAVIDSNKEISVVASTLGRPIGFCLWYYYNKYKQSNNYHILKSRLRNIQLELNRNHDECFICEETGELLCCDTCPNAYHHRCLDLNKADLDCEETWSCPICVKKKTENCRSPASPRKSNAAKYFPVLTEP